MAGGGTKLPRSRPCSNSSASQAASPTSVLRPGRILTWWALTSSSSSPRSSSTYQTGFQYCPVASITTWVTPSAASQSASASRPAVNVAKVRTSWRRPRLWGAGTRTQATTSSLPTSSPLQRSTTSSTATTSDLVDRRPDRYWCPEGPRVNLRDGLYRTKQSRAWPGTTILIRRGGQQP